MICGMIDCIQNAGPTCVVSRLRSKHSRTARRCSSDPRVILPHSHKCFATARNSPEGFPRNVRGPLRLTLTRGVPLILTVDKIKPLLLGSFSETTRSWGTATARALFIGGNDLIHFHPLNFCPTGRCGWLCRSFVDTAGLDAESVKLVPKWFRGLGAITVEIAATNTDELSSRSLKIALTALSCS
jgi:hypothetical protein